jgi:copper homeostasis protein
VIQRLTLEVIVQSVADARAAAEGGADRLEVVRAIDVGGLTPALDLVHGIAAAVRLPLRVMVRGNGGFTIRDGEVATLQQEARSFEAAHVDGIVIGFADRGELRMPALEAVLAAAPGVNVTFHRAFDSLIDPLAALPAIAACGQVDRILSSGGSGPPEARVQALRRYTEAAGRLTVIAGGGVDSTTAALIARAGRVREIHIGRAARADGIAVAPVSADCVERIRNILDRG